MSAQCNVSTNCNQTAIFTNLNVMQHLNPVFTVHTPTAVDNQVPLQQQSGK